MKYLSYDILTLFVVKERKDNSYEMKFLQDSTLFFIDLCHFPHLKSPGDFSLVLLLSRWKQKWPNDRYLPSQDNLYLTGQTLLMLLNNETITFFFLFRCRTRTFFMDVNRKSLVRIPHKF